MIVGLILAAGLYATYARFALGFAQSTHLTDPQPWGDPAIEFAAGGALQWECHWENPTNNEYKFGPFTDTNEHCNWFGFYYPTDSTTESITCVKLNGIATTTVRSTQ